MIARRLSYAIVAVTAGGAGWFFFAYLTRWEWNRALVSGIIFLAAEIALIGALALDRLGKLRKMLVDMAPTNGRRDPRPQVLMRLHESAPPPRNPFAWLHPERTNVFVPVLLGAGVVLSAVAWLVERIARATAGTKMERGLALTLEPLMPPEGGLLARQPDALALLTPQIGGHQ
jgi:hypothetical protein